MRLFFLLGFIILPFTHGGKNFRLGRSKGGNLGAPSGADTKDLPSPQWFTQKLDHFSPSDSRTWQQRFFLNDKYYKYSQAGPVFLMVGGEGPADPRWMVKGAWLEMAKPLGALCIMLEHRYYGESHPTRDISVKNLQYLTSTQALADLALFIVSMKDTLNLPESSKWVAFGGSYPGSLAAWMRLKYPHLVDASVSSSGPLLAKVNFQEYYTVVVNALREKTQDENCVNQLRLAHKQIENLLRTNPKEVDKEFKLCKSIEKAPLIDVKTFWSSIADDFADLVQYNEDNRISANEKYRNLTINSVCNILTENQSSKKAYQRLAAFNAISLDKNNQTCLDFSYENMINELRNISWGNGGEGGRQWMYQTCTEFGFYQTSTMEADTFGNYFDLDYFVQQCQDIFGKKYNEKFISDGVTWTNANYGELKISAKNVIYVHGTIDPWHALGLTVTADNDAPAIFIKGTAHCANMYPSSEKDPEELTRAREEIREFLTTWLSRP